MNWSLGFNFCLELNVLSFVTGQNNFPGHEYEQHDARLHHAVDEAWKQLWFVTVETFDIKLYK